MEERVFRIGRAEFRAARSPSLIETIGLGSCVGVVLYDEGSGVGGMAHIMLPNRVDGRPESRGEGAKYADSGIERLLRWLVRLGADRSRIRARIFGGADMFPNIVKRSGPAVGERNVLAVEQELARLALPLTVRDTGGNAGRSLVLNLATGGVTVRTARGGETEC